MGNYVLRAARLTIGGVDAEPETVTTPFVDPPFCKDRPGNGRDLTPPTQKPAAEFTEADVRKGLRVRSPHPNFLDAGEWTVTGFDRNEYGVLALLSSSAEAEGTRPWLASLLAAAIRTGFVVVVSPATSTDTTPPTQRSGRRFDGAMVRCDAIERTGHVSWCESTADYFVRWDDDDGLRVCCHYAERDLDAELSRDNWRIVSGPQPESPKAQTPRFVQPRIEIAALWSQLPPFPHYVPDHVHPSRAGIDHYARAISPRDASRRAIDETVRGLRGQPFAAAIQAVLVSACTEGKSGERILSRADIDSMVAACRAWEDCRGRVAPGRRTLTPEQAAKCWEAATKVGLWLGGSGEVYERARTL